jgi:hypothetical protein
MMIKMMFDPKEFYRWMRAISDVREAAKFQKWDIPWKMATDYKELLFANIVSGKFANTYAPYSDIYLEWKTYRLGGAFRLQGTGHRMFWRLYGDLLRSLSVFRTKGGVMGGVPAGVKDSGYKSIFSKKRRSKPIAMYARVMEFGLAAHRGKARPVFGPTARMYAQHGWPRRGREALRGIAKQWS